MTDDLALNITKKYHDKDVLVYCSKKLYKTYFKISEELIDLDLDAYDYFRLYMYFVLGIHVKILSYLINPNNKEITLYYEKILGGSDKE